MLWFAYRRRKGRLIIKEQYDPSIKGEEFSHFKKVYNRTKIYRHLYNAAKYYEFFVDKSNQADKEEDKKNQARLERSAVKLKDIANYYFTEAKREIRRDRTLKRRERKELWDAIDELTLHKRLTPGEYWQIRDDISPLNNGSIRNQKDYSTVGSSLN